MFCEAVCCYRLAKPEQARGQIALPFVAPLEEPNYEDVFLLSTGPKIDILDGVVQGAPCKVVVKYKETADLQAPAVAFRLIDAGTEAPCLILSGRRYIFEQLPSLFRVTGMELRDGQLVGIIEQTERSCAEVLDMIKNAHPSAQLSDGVYGSGSEAVGNEGAQLVYEIRAMDGTIKAHACLVARPETGGGSDLDYSSASNASSQPMSEGTARSPCDVSTVYEHANKEDYACLVRELVRSLELKPRPCIVHMLVNKQSRFYFTVVLTRDGDAMLATAYMTRTLFNPALLHNYLTDAPHEISRVLSVSFFPCSFFFLSSNGCELTTEYALQACASPELVQSLRSGANVVMEHSPCAFWMLADAFRSLQPLAWMGLAMVPMIDSMLYLLHGPYNFVVSAAPSLLSRLSEFKYDRINTAIHGSQSLDKSDECANAAAYAAQLQFTKLGSSLAFPLQFRSSRMSRLENFYLDQPPELLCNYVYDLSNGFVLLPRVYAPDERPEGLWALVFDGELDYDALLLLSPDIFPLLAQRACADRDHAALVKIVEQARTLPVVSLVRVLERVSRFNTSLRGALDVAPPSAGIHIANVCACSKKQSKEQIARTETANGAEFTVVDCFCADTGCKRHTKFRYRKTWYDLISVDNLIALVYGGHMSDHVRCSMAIYFCYFNLPVDDRASPVTSQYAFTID
ncbi:hypothetical protein PAPHI01_0092 [Pancytospora philotis]|nr:hypothetical protein PAPHI01_0092 [Pancytospora philotis]